MHCLNGTKIVILTTGHSINDHRVYNKVALSLKQMGADVTLIGRVENYLPVDINVRIVDC